MDSNTLVYNMEHHPNSPARTSKSLVNLHRDIGYLDRKAMEYRHSELDLLQKICSNVRNCRGLGEIVYFKGLIEELNFSRLQLKNIVIFWIMFQKVILCCTIGVHAIYALPDIPYGQLHIATWLTTSQKAPRPHKSPTHGFWHLFRIQVLSRGHSVFKIHSGWQPNIGSPI